MFSPIGENLQIEKYRAKALEKALEAEKKGRKEAEEKAQRLEKAQKEAEEKARKETEARKYVEELLKEAEDSIEEWSHVAGEVMDKARITEIKIEFPELKAPPFTFEHKRSRGLFRKLKFTALICIFSREGFWLRCGMGGGAG